MQPEPCGNERLDIYQGYCTICSVLLLLIFLSWYLLFSLAIICSLFCFIAFLAFSIGAQRCFRTLHIPALPLSKRILHGALYVLCLLIPLHTLLAPPVPLYLKAVISASSYAFAMRLRILPLKSAIWN